MRRKGYSFPEISNKLSVAKTTVYRYTSKIRVLPKFKISLLEKRGGSKKLKILKEKNALVEGKKLVASLSIKEKLLILSALYWAEGSKKDFGLSNTDPGIIKVFVAILRNVLLVKEDRFRVSIRIYEDLDQKKCLSYWSKIVGIPKEKFVSINILKGTKKGKLEFGMCRIRILKGGDLLKKLYGINKSVLAQLEF